MAGVLIRNVPYYSQWESPKLVRRILEDKISAKNDPSWKSSGARNPTEYELWSKNGCGMACLKMVLAYKTGKKLQIVKLGKKCASYGGYKIRWEKIDGLYYYPFLKFINKEFGLSGKVLAPMSTKDIVKKIKNNNFVIASVHHSIRNPSSNPSKKGGHLILVLGFDSERRIFYFHNPSGHLKSTQEYAEISYVDFGKFFANRGIVIEG